MNDVEDEKGTWQAVHGIAALKKIFFAAFLKVILPLEALRSMGTEGVGILKDHLNDAYDWTLSMNACLFFDSPRKS